MIKKGKKVIVSKSKIITSKLGQALGLMFSTPKLDFALIFDFKREINLSLHMFFVFYTIDVLFLNSERKIVEIKKDFKPFSVYFPKSKFRYVIEVCKKTKLKVGDSLNF